VVKGDGIELLLGVDVQVWSLGQVSAQQAIGVLLDAHLPRAVGMGKEHLDTCALAQGLVLGHLLAIVLGHRLTHGRVKTVED
jgi:hypothetical protein